MFLCIVYYNKPQMSLFGPLMVCRTMSLDLVYFAVGQYACVGGLVTCAWFCTHVAAHDGLELRVDFEFSSGRWHSTNRARACAHSRKSHCVAFVCGIVIGLSHLVFVRVCMLRLIYCHGCLCIYHNMHNGYISHARRVSCPVCTWKCVLFDRFICVCCRCPRQRVRAVM